MTERHRKKLMDAWHYLLALPRSAWLNLRLLPWSQARHMPLLVSHRTRVHYSSGRLTIEAEKLRIGLVKVGFATYQGSDFRRDRTRLFLHGQLIVEGDCSIGAGCSIEVGEGARMKIGHDFHLGPKSLVICHKEIVFGAHNLTSWCCTIMDTDQHGLADADNRRVNEDRAVVTGRNVWLGCHVMVPKGVQLADDTTVAASARLTGRYDEPMTVLAGNPAAVVSRGVRRVDL